MNAPVLSASLPRTYLQDGQVFGGKNSSSVPLTVQGVSGQTAHIFDVKASDGTVLFSVDNSGNLTAAGTITITVSQIVTGNITASGNLSIGGTSLLTGAVTTGNGLTVGSTLTVVGTSLQGGLATFNNGINVAGTTNLNGQVNFNGTVAFTGGATFGGTISPAVNDGAALGTTALSWSDLFLAQGAVISFNAGGTTITHSTAQLTLASTAVAAGGILLQVSPGNHTAIVANNPALNVNGATYTLTDGTTLAFATWAGIQQATYNGAAGGGTETITDGATLYVAGGAKQGTNLTMVDSHGIYVATNTVGSASRGWGLSVFAPTGATTNYAAQLVGTVIIGSGDGTATTTGGFSIRGADGVGSNVVSAGSLTIRPGLSTGNAGAPTLTLQGPVNRQVNSSTPHPVQTLITLGYVHNTALLTNGLVNFPGQTYIDRVTGNGTAATAMLNVFGQPTLQSGTATTTNTNSATVYVVGAPIQSTNTALTDTHSVFIAATTSTNGTGAPTRAWGLTVTPPTGASTNYAAQFLGTTVVGSGEGTGVTAGATLRGPIGAGSGVSGKDFTIAAGQGTGAVAAGVIKLQAAINGVTSGSPSTAHTTSTIAQVGYISTSAIGTTGIFSLPAVTYVDRWTGNGTTASAMMYTFGQPTMQSETATTTITNASTVYIAGAPLKSTNVALTATSALYIDSAAVSTATASYGLTVNAQSGATTNYAAQFLGGAVVFGKMIVGAQGTSITSANDATLTATGNFFSVTGATQMNTLSIPTGVTAGTIIVLQFASNPVVKNATAGTGAQFNLAGSADFNTTANDTLTLVYNGSVWAEVARTAI